jgi:hypothetical protein
LSTDTLERAKLLADQLMYVATKEPLKIVVVDDEGVEQHAPVIPDTPPDWAMPLDVHNATFQRTATYRCTVCGGEHEEYRQNPRELPYAKVCGCIQVLDRDDESDGSLDKCTGVALRRTTYPGEGVPLNARRFERMVLFRYVGEPPRGIEKYYVPGRNHEPTESNYERIEITDIAHYNRVVKEVNSHEVRKMSDHRSMHEEYWKARRRAMRDHVDARIRHNPTLVSLARIIRKISDAKSARRYGKPLDSRFHGQLIEFNQGSIQDFCAEDTKWRATRAK